MEIKGRKVSWPRGKTRFNNVGIARTITVESNATVSVVQVAPGTPSSSGGRKTIPFSDVEPLTSLLSP